MDGGGDLLGLAAICVSLRDEKTERHGLANRHLIADLQVKLRSRADQDLLAIWIENDQDQWSPEFFEAVRLVLTERGVPAPAPAQGVPGSALRASGVVHQLEYEVPERPSKLQWWLKCGRIVLIVDLLCGVAVIVADWIGSGKFQSRPAAPVISTPWPSQTRPTTRP